MPDDTQSSKRKKDEKVTEEPEEEQGSVSKKIETVARMPEERSGPLELQSTNVTADDTTSSTADDPSDPDIDVIGEVDDEHDIPIIPPVTSSGEPTAVADESMKTPTKKRAPVPLYRGDNEEEHDPEDGERVFSSFPCQVIPETLTRMTRTPPDGEHLIVHKNSNGRLRIFVIDHFQKFSAYSNLTHKPCTVCNRIMKAGEMHLNFPADLDRRRIWANLLGFKYKDILRSKMGPVSYSIAAGPICTEHFAEECFRNHNFNKSAIEAFGVPVAISPDVKTTPSKKSYRVPWVCTICDFHSCSVVELQTHLLDHTEEMLKKKDSVVDFQVPDAGFMCPFCRKCTYGYKTISGYRRHLNAGPIHHCHLRRIYEFAKMNCRATELDPVDSWDNWTRRNVYVAYHGCEPPANEIVLTPSPTKKAHVQNPEERTRLVHDEERRKKAVRSLSFVGKEGGTSVNDHNVMQRQVYLQIRRELELSKKAADGTPVVSDNKEVAADKAEKTTPQEEESVEEMVDVDGFEEDEEEISAPVVVKKVIPASTPTAPMGSAEKRKSGRFANATNTTTPAPAASATSSPVKKGGVKKPAGVSTASAPSTPAKKRKISAKTEESPAPVEEPPTAATNVPATATVVTEEVSPTDPRERLRQKIRDERFAEMVQKRSQQVTRLINAKKFKKLERSPQRPRKAIQYTLMKGITSSGEAVTSSVEPEDVHEPTPEPPSTDKPSTSTSSTSTVAATSKKPAAPSPTPVVRITRSHGKPPATVATPPVITKKIGKKEKETPAPAPQASSPPGPPKDPEERPLKSMLARSLTAGERPSMAKYHVQIGPFSPNMSKMSTGAGTGRSTSSSAAIARPEASSSPGGGGGLFLQRVHVGGGDKGPPAKRPAVLARRPLILSPRKARAPSNPRQTITTSHTISHHESSPSLMSTSSAASAPMTVPLTSSGSEEFLISAKDMEVEMIEEVIDSVIAQSAASSSLKDLATSSSSPTATANLTTNDVIRQLTLAEALESGAAGESSVKDQDLEEISKKMMEESSPYYRVMEDAIKCRTVTKMRADMRLSRHCIRQIEAARARARLFGEGTEDYQIYYSNDGAQVLTKSDPKWRELQQQQQPGPSDQE